MDLKFDVQVTKMDLRDYIGSRLAEPMGWGACGPRAKSPLSRASLSPDIGSLNSITSRYLKVLSKVQSRPACTMLTSPPMAT